MKTSVPRTLQASRGDIALLDLLAILAAVAVVGLVAFVFLSKPRMRTKAINCTGHLKQMGLAFRLWAGDNGDKFPAQVSTNAGGTLELTAGGAVYPHFVVMSNEISTPRVLVCPSEPNRAVATDFSNLRDINLSYFVGVDTIEPNENLWVSGDRNVSTNGRTLRRGVIAITTNLAVSWTTAMHSNQGNICFADGRVEQHTVARLQASTTNALRAYFEATTNTSFRIAIP